MNALSILFRTDRFNLSKVRENFINPCYFGEDLASWLRSRLVSIIVEASEPYQEDWGWELPVKHGNDSYYLCISGNADEPGSGDSGEWRILVEKKRSLWERVTRRITIREDDPLVSLLEQIFASESRIGGLRRESEQRPIKL
jgi:hypothetical protein